MRTLFEKAKSESELQSVIAATQKLWRRYHSELRPGRYVAKEVRRQLTIERPKPRQRVVARLSQAEEQKLIQHVYRMKGVCGLLIKTLLQTGAPHTC